MQANFGDLLEEIDKAGKITVEVLEKKGFDRSLIELVGKYYDLIRLDIFPDRVISNPLNASDYLIVSPKGFEYLNPIKIKKAIEQFNESSDNYSKKLIDLTSAIYVFTVIVAAIPLIDKVLQLTNLNNPLFWIFSYFVLIITMVAVMLIFFKKYYGKKSN